MNLSDKAILNEIIEDAQSLLRRCAKHGLAWSVVNVSVVIDGLKEEKTLGESIDDSAD